MGPAGFEPAFQGNFETVSSSKAKMGQSASRFCGSPKPSVLSKLYYGPDSFLGFFIKEMSAKNS